MMLYIISQSSYWQEITSSNRCLSSSCTSILYLSTTAMADTIVLYPSRPIGHLASMLQLGKLLLTHQPSLAIHILITNPPYRADSTAPLITSFSATFPSIIFHHLPPITLSPSAMRRHQESLTFEIVRLNIPNVHRALLSISQNFTVHALVIDFFCTEARSVAAHLNIPAYYFFTSAAACLASLLYLPTLHKNTDKSFEDMGNTPVQIPGLPPIPAKDLPKPLLDRNDQVYQHFLDMSTQLPTSAGIIINTFEMLEPRAIQAMTGGFCVPDGSPIYCIGPLISSGEGRHGGGGAAHECLTWLDSQPKQSVVFLCFGSLGLFSKSQLHEIAVGLERSGQRFLWVVRNPPVSNDQSVAITNLPDPDLNSLLPQGFLDRTRERGMIVKSWAPQVAVLSHESVGGFVSHCGWNSVLEAICCGVPLVAWPLYAEQRFNRVVLVEEMKIALPMVESEDRFVSSTEVEKRVRELMEREEGRSVREGIKAMKAAAKEAMSLDGSSHVALTKLTELWKNLPQ